MDDHGSSRILVVENSKRSVTMFASKLKVIPAGRNEMDIDCGLNCFHVLSKGTPLSMTLF